LDAKTLSWYWCVC